MHARIFSRNIRARVSVYARTIIRNVCAQSYAILRARGVRACTYTIFCACASVIIVAHTSTCLCVRAWASVSIHAHALVIIRARGDSSPCLSIVLPNTSMAVFTQ